MERKVIIERIRKLRRLAEGTQFPAERDVALDKAALLMRVYGVQESDLLDADGDSGRCDGFPSGNNKRSNSGHSARPADPKRKPPTPTYRQEIMRFSKEALASFLAQKANRQLLNRLAQAEYELAKEHHERVYREIRDFVERDPVGYLFSSTYRRLVRDRAVYEGRMGKAGSGRADTWS